jgi:hypothetical protein
MRLLQGRLGCVKTWLAVGLRGVVSWLVIKTREPAWWGASLRVDEVRMSGFQACDSLRFDLQAPAARNADNKERSGGERSWPFLKQEAAG